MGNITKQGRVCHYCRQILPTNHEFTSCVDCRNGLKLRNRKRQESNTCVVCGIREPITRGKMLRCQLCFLRSAAGRHLGSTKRWMELRTLFEKQGGVCPYTNRQLTLGIDASVDHILPKSRYPELKYDISNIEWVHVAVNFMKNDMTRDEFLAFVKEISANFN